MAIGIISNGRQAVMYCTTSDWAFGPVFNSEEDAESFIDYVKNNPKLDLVIKRVGFDGTDPREYDNAGLETLYLEWLKI